MKIAVGEPDSGAAASPQPTSAAAGDTQGLHIVSAPTSAVLGSVMVTFSANGHRLAAHVRTQELWSPAGYQDNSLIIWNGEPE